MRVFKYIIFAVIATIINIFFQKISHTMYDGYLSLYIGMIVGTIAGLIVKFVLDKKFIFYYKVKNKADNAIKFFLYSCVGVLTTAIFWIVEIAFDHVFQGESARYIGGVIGLAIGYSFKYILDKKFVFISESRIETRSL
jgi:putative flippase GtrA